MFGSRFLWNSRKIEISIKCLSAEKWGSKNIMKKPLVGLYKAYLKFLCLLCSIVCEIYSHIFGYRYSIQCWSRVANFRTEWILHNYLFISCCLYMTQWVQKVADSRVGTCTLIIRKIDFAYGDNFFLDLVLITVSHHWLEILAFINFFLLRRIMINNRR